MAVSFYWKEDTSSRSSKAAVAYGALIVGKEVRGVAARLNFIIYPSVIAVLLQRYVETDDSLEFVVSSSDASILLSEPEFTTIPLAMVNALSSSTIVFVT